MKVHAPGTLIAGRYEVASRPMMGGMGIVYICLDHEQDRPVALKTFRPEYLPNRAARDRFLREGTHWVDLGMHPHIVRCYQVVRTEDGLEVYLALELIAREQNCPDASLRSWLIPGRPLPVETALLFTLQVARGMRHAVARIPGFVHRDLKPENVLVGADHLPGTTINRLRVTDFGLASVIQEAGSKRQNVGSVKQEASAMRHTQLTHGAVGTPLYMAPEQWTGQPVGVYTDVYALGCILYEMLTGYTAATGDNPDDWARAHCTGDLRPLPETIPAPVRYLLARCLAFAPASRYLEWDNVEFVLRNAYAAVTGESAPPSADTMTLSHEERVAVGWSYNTIGGSYLDIGKAEVAVSYFERAAAVGQAEGEQALEGAALSNLGLAYACLGDVRRTIGYYEQCLEIAREIGNQDGEGAALNNLGDAYRRLGDARRALEYLEQALAIAYEIKDQRRICETLSNLGTIYQGLGSWPHAIEFYEQALAIALEIGDRRIEEGALGNLGLVYWHLGNKQRAIDYHNEALTIAREIGDRSGEGTALGSLGLIYTDLGDFPRAIELYEQHRAIAQEIGDRDGEGTALGNLGRAYAEMKDMRRAIEYYELRLRVARETGNRYGEGITLGNLGNTYFSLGDAKIAIGLYSQALTISREIGDVEGVAWQSFNMAILYTEQDNYTQAISLAQEAARIWTQIGSPNAQRAQKLISRLQNAAE